MSSPARILIVDDDQPLAEGLRRMLTSAGYLVPVVATSGAEAIVHALDHPPDLILMDLMLGDQMDGIEVAARIRAARDVPIIFLTGATADHNLSRAQQTGVYGYLLKPIRAEELRIAIEMALYRHQMDQQLLAVNLRLEREIAERQETQEQIEYQANLLQNVSDAIIATDLNLRITSWNAAAERMYGWQEQDVLGKNLDAVVRTEFLTMTQQEAQQMLLTQQFWKGEVRQQRKDGTPIYTLAAVSFIKNRQGHPIGGVTVNHDITREKQREEQIRALARFPDENPNPVLRVTPDGALLYANAASRGVLDAWQIPSETANRSPAEMIAGLPAELRSALAVAFITQIRQDVEVTAGERTFFFTVTPLAEASYANLYGYDITDRKEAELARVREFQALEAFAKQIRSRVTAETFQALPLAQSVPFVFQELIGQYAQILDHALEQHLYKVEHGVSQALNDLADRLGFLRATPRDVITLHVTALKQKTTATATLKVQAYTDAGRMALLELMGYLVSYYRLRIGAFESSHPIQQKQEGNE